MLKTLFKYVSWFILFVGVLCPMGFGFLIFQFELHAIKKEVKEQLVHNIPKADLQTLTWQMGSAELQQLKWEHSTEFELNGKMYDVIEADTIGKTVYYVCFLDDEETLLKYNFKELLQKAFAGKNDKEGKGRGLCIFFQNLYANSFTFFTSSFAEPTLATFDKYKFALKSYSFLPEIPPPNFWFF